MTAKENRWKVDPNPQVRYLQVVMVINFVVVIFFLILMLINKYNIGIYTFIILNIILLFNLMRLDSKIDKIIKNDKYKRK